MGLVQRLKAMLRAARPVQKPKLIDVNERSVEIFGYPIKETFVEQDYLDFNPDVAHAVRAGAFVSGRDHFDQFGHLRTHRIPIKDAMDKVVAIRRVKSRRISELLEPNLSIVTDESH